MQNSSVELSGYKIYQFNSSVNDCSHIVVEYGDKYLSAELINRVDGQNALAVWIFPENIKGKAIHTDNIMELERKLEKETVENRNKILLKEIVDCMIIDFKVMEYLEHYAIETVSQAEIFLKQVFLNRQDIWTLSFDEFVKFRHEIKAEFNAGELSKEDYSQKVTKSYYANRNYNILQMNAVQSLSSWFESTTGLKMPYSISQMIYRYIEKNKKSGDLCKYIVSDDVYNKQSKVTITRSPKKRKTKLLYNYQLEYETIKLFKQPEEKKVVVAVEFGDYLLLAELRQDPNDNDRLIFVWLGPEIIKGREFSFFLYQLNSYSGKVLDMYDQELSFEKMFEQQIAERLLLDFQFLNFVGEHHLLLVDLYKKFQKKYAAFPTCKGAISKEEAIEKKKELTQQKKKGLISDDERKMQIRQIEKDRRKYERMTGNIRDAMYWELKKIFGAPVNYTYFYCIEQLIKENQPSEMLLTLYTGERAEY